MDAYKALIGKPEVTSPLGRPSCKWEDNVKKDLREMGSGCGVIGTSGGL
jgi:hypothetical protein